MGRRRADTIDEIERALGGVDGREILDVGCGRGRLAAALARRGARVAAIDPDAAAVEAARRIVPLADVRQGTAEALPFADGSFDGVVMLNSLHHVPGRDLANALRETSRVSRPGAPIVVVEPLAEGTFFEAMRPLEDETELRLAAQNALTRACAPDGPLVLVEVHEFERVEPFRDVDEFLQRLVDADPARAGAVDRARAEVTARFTELVEHEGQGQTLRQPLRMHRFVKG